MNNASKLNKAELILELEAHGVEVHHATSESKLRQILTEVEAGTYKKPVKVDKNEPTIPLKPEALVKPAPLTKEEKAMRLIRIVVTPNDPLLNTYHGLIFTVCSSDINKGRAIKKFVPFNNEEGYHVPHAIYEQIVNAEMQKFKNAKLPNGETISVPYITKKYNVRVLPPLTKEELAALAAAQKARGGL